jgi:hypothetical protein
MARLAELDITAPLSEERLGFLATDSRLWRRSRALRLKKPNPVFLRLI